MTQPDQFMEKAREVRDRLCLDCECKFEAGCGCLEAISDAIQEARKSERERCAEIARRRIVGGYLHGSPEWPDGDDIANAILSERTD